MKTSIYLLSCPVCGETACSGTSKVLSALCSLPVRCKNCHHSLTCHEHISQFWGLVTVNSLFAAAIFYSISYKTLSLTLLFAPFLVALPLVLRARFYERKKRRFFRDSELL